MSREITVRYESIDHFRKRAMFKTLEGAQKFAQKYVGETPEISQMFGYAVSFDGVGKVTWEGCTAEELFPKLNEVDDSWDARYGGSSDASHSA